MQERRREEEQRVTSMTNCCVIYYHYHLVQHKQLKRRYLVPLYNKGNLWSFKTIIKLNQFRPKIESSLVSRSGNVSIYLFCSFQMLIQFLVNGQRDHKALMRVCDKEIVTHRIPANSLVKVHSFVKLSDQYFWFIFIWQFSN